MRKKKYNEFCKLVKRIEALLNEPDVELYYTLFAGNDGLRRVFYNIEYNLVTDKKALQLMPVDERSVHFMISGDRFAASFNEKADLENVRNRFSAYKKVKIKV